MVGPVEDFSLRQNLFTSGRQHVQILNQYDCECVDYFQLYRDIFCSFLGADLLIVMRDVRLHFWSLKAPQCH